MTTNESSTTLARKSIPNGSTVRGLASTGELWQGSEWKGTWIRGKVIPDRGFPPGASFQLRAVYVDYLWQVVEN